MDLRKARPERTVQFRKDRFGMFIHWGIYAIPARGEWVRSQERISVEDYQPFFDSFNPYEYDPKAWAKLAKEAGMCILCSPHTLYTSCGLLFQAGLRGHEKRC